MGSKLYRLVFLMLKIGFNFSCELSPLEKPIFWENKKYIVNLSFAECCFRLVNVKYDDACKVFNNGMLYSSLHKGKMRN